MKRMLLIDSFDVKLGFCFFALLALTAQGQIDANQDAGEVCEAWKQSEDANYSFVVSISSKQGLHFCTGALVDIDWVLTTYSCFQRLIQHTQNPTHNSPSSSLDSTKTSNLIEVSSNRFDISNTEVLVRTATDNCAQGDESYIRDNKRFALAKQGIIHPGYRLKKFDNPRQVQNESLRNESSSENKSFDENQVQVHKNDLLLLKLGASFPDVPVEHMQLKAFDYNKKFDYQILSWGILDILFSPFFGYVDVEPEFDDNFKCNEELCGRESSFCKGQTYVCAKFEFPKIDLASYHLHTGDILAEREADKGLGVFGFFSEDFMGSEMRVIRDQNSYNSDTYYTYKFGNYSFIQKGSIFQGLKQTQIDWVRRVSQSSLSSATRKELSELSPINEVQKPSSVVVSQSSSHNVTSLQLGNNSVISDEISTGTKKKAIVARKIGIFKPSKK